MPKITHEVKSARFRPNRSYTLPPYLVTDEMRNIEQKASDRIGYDQQKREAMAEGRYRIEETEEKYNSDLSGTGD